MAAETDTGFRVYCGNLSWSVDEGMLQDEMAVAGSVVNTKILRYPDGASKGCAVVTFASQEDGERAIDQLNDYEIAGRKVFLRPDREEAGFGQNSGFRGRRGGRGRGGSRGGRGGRGRGGAGGFRGGRGRGRPSGTTRRPAAADPKCSVYFGNLPFSTSWQDLKDLARQHGDVVRADVHMENGRSRGSGVVVFGSVADAEAAIAALNGTTYEERELDVHHDKFAQKPGCTLYVGNLPYSVTWQDLKDTFRAFGEVARSDVVVDYQGRSKGYGTVTFEDSDDALKAIEALNESEMDGRQIQVRLDVFSNPGAADE